MSLVSGCTRAWYRCRADRETYEAIAERMDDPRWTVPSTSMEPAPESRNFDPAPPDCPPLPPDDPAAHRYMHCVDGIEGYEGWHDLGDAMAIENPHWRDSLVLSEDGEVILQSGTAVELGVLHSRKYQSELEDLYLAALALTLERFEFDLQWFGGNDTTFLHFGSINLSYLALGPSQESVWEIEDERLLDAIRQQIAELAAGDQDEASVRAT